MVRKKNAGVVAIMFWAGVSYGAQGQEEGKKRSQTPHRTHQVPPPRDVVFAHVTSAVAAQALQPPASLAFLRKNKAFQGLLRKRVLVASMCMVLSDFLMFTLPYLGHKHLAAQAPILREALRRIFENTKGDLQIFLKEPACRKYYVEEDFETKTSARMAFAQEQWRSYSMLMPQFFTPKTFQRALVGGEIHEDRARSIFWHFSKFLTDLKRTAKNIRVKAGEREVFDKFFWYGKEVKRKVMEFSSQLSQEKVDAAKESYVSKLHGEACSILEQMFHHQRTSCTSMKGAFGEVYHALKETLRNFLRPLVVSPHAEDHLGYVLYKTRLAVLDLAEKRLFQVENKEIMSQKLTLKTFLEHAHKLEALKNQAGQQPFEGCAAKIRSLVKKYEDKE